MLFRRRRAGALLCVTLFVAACVADPRAIVGPDAKFDVIVSGGAGCNRTVGGGTTPDANIQAAINAAAAGNTICVYPGNYNETAAGSAPTSLGGVYQFGLFFPSSKPGLKLVGVNSAGDHIASAGTTAAKITTNATNNFGFSGIFVEGANVVIQGLEIGDNIPGNNKTIEVVADNFTLQYSKTSVTGGGAVYISEFDPPAGPVSSYHILGNSFADATQIAISSGAGQGGSVAGREIKGNLFVLNGNLWPAISFNGAGGVPWYTKPVGGAQITGNSFFGAGEQWIRARGVYTEAEFDWESYWLNNNYGRGTVALVSEVPFTVRSYSYVSAPYTFTNVRRIGANIQNEVNNASAGDIVKVRQGTYAESPLIAKSLTLKAGPGIPNIVLQNGPTYLGALTLDGLGSNITVEGFVITGRDAVGGGLASSNVYVPQGLGSVLLKDNVIKVGLAGTGSNGDDGIGLITNYAPSGPLTTSLTVDHNRFEGVTANGGTRAYYINPSVDGFTFVDNLILGRFAYNAATEAKVGLVEKNKIDGTGSAGNRSAGFASNAYAGPGWGTTTYRRNTITGSRGIRIGNGAADNVVDHNFFTLNSEAVTISSNPTTNKVNRNSILTSDNFDLVNTAVGAVDATCNYYDGGAAGPNPAKLSGAVTTVPYLWTSNLDGACTTDHQGPITTLTAPVPAPINTTIAVPVSISDLTTGNSNLKSYTWTRDGGAPLTVNFATAAVTQNVNLNVTPKPSADVDRICVKGTDIWDNTGPEVCVLVVWYDPNAGFVTGGGWIDSPAGAYTADPSLTGKANFGFVAKYEKGKTAPSGNTEFQFKAGDLNFSSSSLEWLVVAGSKAQFKGAGTINGAGDYRFMLTVIDGDMNGAKKADTFRIRIWNNVGGGLVYDNLLNAPDSDDPTTVIGGGNISIKK